MSNSAATASAAKRDSTVAEHDAIVRVMNLYTEGIRTGNSSEMRPAFHEACTFYGYFAGKLLAGPIQILFDWVDGNGASEGIETRIASVDIRDTIASVRVEINNMTGKLTDPSPATLTDLFQLIKVDGRWQISQKSFHWHAK